MGTGRSYFPLRCLQAQVGNNGAVALAVGPRCVNPISEYDPRLKKREGTEGKGVFSSQAVGRSPVTPDTAGEGLTG